MRGRQGQWRTADPHTIVQAREHKSVCACTGSYGTTVGYVLIAINYY